MSLDNSIEKLLYDFSQDLQEIEFVHKDVLSKRFNIFESAGLTRQEIRHSNILAFLLDPNEAHGLKSSLLKGLLDYCASNTPHHEFAPTPLNITTSEFEDIQITREENRFDVLGVSNPNKFLFVIENKIGSGEGRDQLETYRNKINSTIRYNQYKKLFIYLTINGEDPSEEGWWTPLSYSVVLDLLEKSYAKHKDDLTDDADIFIRHYIDLIRRYILSELNPELKADCEKIYNKHRKIIEILNKNIELDLPRKKAINAFLENIDAQRIFVNGSSTRFHFLPKKLYSLMPDEQFGKVGWAGQKAGKPIQIWFEFYEQIKLVLEIGPMVNIELRTKIVEVFYKEFRKKVTKSKGDVYTRIKSIAETSPERPTEEETLDIMTRLYEKFIDEHDLEKTIKVVKDIWK